jgi:two-component system OmpR family sensor kinase
MKLGAMPLSARLAITYALLVASTLAVVGAMVFELTRGHLDAQMERALRGVVASFERGPAQRSASPADLEEESSEWVQSQILPDGIFVVVRTQSGTVQSEWTHPLEEIDELASLLDANRRRMTRVDGPDGDVLILAEPLFADGARFGTLVVGESTGATESTVAALLRRILIASAVGLAFAAVLGLIAVRRTLRPLAQISRDIELIQSTGDLSLHAPSKRPSNEVGRLAEAFDGLLTRLDEAFRAQRRFLSDASHELRTPLTVVRGQLELLANDARDSATRRSLDIAIEELERTRRIVRDLLLLARLDEGMALERAPIEVELVLREALLRGMLLGRRRTHVDCPRGLYVLGDPDRLFQVLANLVINAVQHAGENAELTLRAVRRGGAVEISVSDTGPGIPEGELPHVFERFHRGPTARSSAPGGAGLGLAIAASLVRSMGGDITVRSVQGVGTTFIVTLEAADQPSETERRARVGYQDA